MDSKTLEPQAQRALEYLHKQAGQHGQDRANADYLDAFLKSERARLKGQVIGQSNAAAEDVALAHPDYLKCLEAKKIADEINYTNLFKREAASAVIAAWQTVSANERRLP